MSKLIPYLFGWVMPFLKWLEHSFTGNDGKASHRKISSFVMMLLIIYTTVKLNAKEIVSTNHLFLLLILVGTFLLLAGILTVQNIISIIKNKDE